MEETIGLFGLLIYVAVIGILLVAGWRVYTKANQPGWAWIVPIYNVYVLTQIVGRPWWWLLLLLVPVVNFVIGLILCIDLSKSFGKGAGFGIGLTFLSPIFLPILAFGDAEYQGASAKQTA